MNNPGHAWLAYLLIAVIASWPLSTALTSAIPIGCEGEATVPLLNVWTLWWNSDRAAAGFQNYWDAPIFYPAKGTFAFSESQPTMSVMAPIVWMTGNRALGYNVYLLLILSLNGCSSRSLLRRVGHRPWLAFCGGVMCELLPFVWWQLGAVQLTTVFGINWTVHAVLDIFEPPTSIRSTSPSGEFYKSNDPQFPRAESLIRAVRLGGSFGLTYCLCNYWGLFAAMLIIPSSVSLWNRRLRQPRFWCELGLAAIVTIVLIGPIVFVQRAQASEHRWTRERSLIVELSAHPRDYLDSPRTNVGDEPVAWTMIPQLEFPEAGRADAFPLSGGGFKTMIAPLGLISALLVQNRRRWGIFMAIFAALAFGISLGPTIIIAEWVPVLHGQCPYEILQKLVPGFALIRSPFRFALFVQLAIVWLSIDAIDLLDPRRWRLASFRFHKVAAIHDGGCAQQTAVSKNDMGKSSISAGITPVKVAPMMVVGMVAMVSFSLIASFEVLPPRQQLYSDVTHRPLPVWVMWLKENSAKGDAIVCLPLPNGRNVGDYQATSEWMYWATFHGRPLVNGYSGFFPETFVQLKDQFLLEPEGSVTQLKMYPWDCPGLRSLNESGARFVVLKRSFASRDDVWDHAATQFRWVWVTGDELNQVDVYEIQPN